MQRANRPARNAFTLLELIAVIVLLGLVSAITLLSVVGHLEQSELVRVAQSLARADGKERDTARQSPQPGALLFDRTRKRFLYKTSERTIDISTRIKSAEMIVDSSQSDEGSIVFSQSGQSPSYAIGLVTSRGASRWLLVIGMTGQVLYTDSVDEVRSIMAMGK